MSEREGQFGPFAGMSSITPEGFSDGGSLGQSGLDLQPELSGMPVSKETARLQRSLGRLARNFDVYDPENRAVAGVPIESIVPDSGQINWYMIKGLSVVLEGLDKRFIHAYKVIMGNVPEPFSARTSQAKAKAQRDSSSVRFSQPRRVVRGPGRYSSG